MTTFPIAILIFLYIRFVRKFLRLSIERPQYDRLLVGLMVGIAGLQLLDWIVGDFRIGGVVYELKLNLIGHGVMIVVAVMMYQLRALPLARLVFWAILPYAVIVPITVLIRMGLPTLYKPNKDFFEGAITFAFFWLGALMIYAQRQKKTLEKERLEREAEAERNRQDKAFLEGLVSERTAELTRQKEELQHALEELRATQDQLVQREKLASLGELTAGIAHEIQNPLNFVNNFSEVSAELVKELLEEREKGQPGEPGGRDEALEQELLADLEQNLQKITQHGSRASSIVRGMLEHSRTSTGERQRTDLNALADEYLRLSYHGLRAKDKSFNAELTLDLDPTLPKADVVSQDVGRVLLNLYTNAFYAVQQRQKQGEPGYQPTVTVSTRFREADPPNRPEGATSSARPTGLGNGVIEIRVHDNGTGMPDAVKAKIFQPFFTTKPTGQGTGLGLSLSYDIVTKGHGGTLDVESVEGEGTTFVVKLPA